MGGRGSGRPPERYAVCDSRSLSVGELLARTPAGKPNCEISWRTLTGGRLTARLSFRPVGTQRASERATQTIELRYWPTLTDPFTRQAIVVPGGGRAPSILCPVCGAAVRKLYAPPGADRFACRTCHGLVYRRPRGPDPALELPTVLGPLLPELFERTHA